MTEGHDNVGEATRRQNSFDLSNDTRWTLRMFENRVTLDTLKKVTLEGKLMGVGYDVHTFDRE